MLPLATCLLVALAATTSFALTPSGAPFPAPVAALAPLVPLTPPVRRYELVVELGRAAPACLEKQVVTVNGGPAPTLEVVEGQTMEVYVENRLPAAWPSVNGGITLHWHGLSMEGAQFYDGVAFVQQCPIPPGGNMTYRFKALEHEGTYWYHGHSALERIDGLQGLLIIRPNVPVTPAVPYDEEKTLVFSDVYHATSAALTFPLNRPFDAAKSTNETGGWEWVDIPQAITLNGHGYYKDCSLRQLGNTANLTCNVTQQWVPRGRSLPEPYASPASPGCARENVTVAAGQSYLLRMVNTGSLSYFTVCFEGHNVTLVAADGYPVKPLVRQCVDINAGQRMDVVLKADQKPGNYWITAQMQFRAGAISGYSVLRYEGVNKTLPEAPIAQPMTLYPWTDADYMELRSPDATQSNGSTTANSGGSSEGNFLKPLSPSSRTLVYNNTQPLLADGQLRWALNNVATYETPTCTAALADLVRDHGWLEEERSATQLRLQGGTDLGAVTQQDGNTTAVDMYVLAESPMPAKPVAGQLYTVVKLGEVVDIVIQNMAANANGGDYRNSSAGRNRTAQEQHPFHLHGYHFWVLGRGKGLFDTVESPKSYNLVDPPYRDTNTVFQGQWTAVRFVADNPGLWTLHCHLDYHLFMGQRAYFLVGLDNLTAVPEEKALFPKCPAACNYNFAPWKPATVASLYGDSGYSY